MQTQEEMNILVPARLKALEEERGLKVLWAVESGSRAWGFASPDSDYDVRFIYKRKPSEYLKLNPGRDVIEEPVDETWDIAGWDLDKSLRLLQKSNPALYEWMNSPIVYIDTDFKVRMEELLAECFSEKRMLYHYVNTSRNAIRSYLKGEEVRPKKYFHALRPILVCRWIMEKHSIPPVLFRTLYDTVLEENMKEKVDELLKLKTEGGEKDTIAPIKEIDDYLSQQIERILAYIEALPPEKEPYLWDNLNKFFYEEINR